MSLLRPLLLNLYCTLPVSLPYSWNETAVTFLSQQLRSDASVAANLAAQQLPDFGVNASSIRSVLVNNTAVEAVATPNGTAYLVSIQMTVILVGLRSTACSIRP